MLFKTSSRLVIHPVLPYLPMACPCFYPVERLPDSSSRLAAAPPPLGDYWSGECRASPVDSWHPDRDTVQELCNFGYAGGKCPHFSGDSPDAVRFCISSDRDEVIGVYWVLEKNHGPFAHGPLDYSRKANGFTTAPADDRLTQQAKAYVSSYLRRKETPGTQ